MARTLYSLISDYEYEKKDLDEATKKFEGQKKEFEAALVKFQTIKTDLEYELIKVGLVEHVGKVWRISRDGVITSEKVVTSFNVHLPSEKEEAEQLDKEMGRDQDNMTSRQPSIQPNHPALPADDRERVNSNGLFTV